MPANSEENKGKRMMPEGKRWKPGQSGNPKGRPKDGQSWSAIISSVGDMYSDDLLEVVGRNNELGKQIAKYPKSVQLKYLVIARVFAALMFDPSPSLLKEFLDRLEGKVKERLDVTSGDEKLANLSDDEKILRILALVKKAGNAES